jgi:hypothetical protein
MYPKWTPTSSVSKPAPLSSTGLRQDSQAAATRYIQYSLTGATGNTYLVSPGSSYRILFPDNSYRINSVFPDRSYRIYSVSHGSSYHINFVFPDCSYRINSVSPGSSYMTYLVSPGSSSRV